MESLLRWSIENSAPTDGNVESPPPRRDLDPGIIEAILGKPDAEQMKDDMAVVMDDKRNEDDRVAALDHLEMLIEQIDNANNLDKLQMWKPLHSLLTVDTSTDLIVMQTLWVIGTALQNNPAAQESYLSLSPIPVLTSFLAPSGTTPQIRSKALYTLSGLLKHNAPAVRAFGDPETDGWTVLRNALQDPDISVRRKAAFLLNTLLIPTPTNEQPSSSAGVPIHANSHAAHLAHPDRTATSPLTLTAIKDYHVLNAVIDSLSNPVPYGEDGDIDEPDPDFVEKAVSVLKTYAIDCGGDFDLSQKKALHGWLAKERARAGSDGESGLATNLGVGEIEFHQLVEKF